MKIKRKPIVAQTGGPTRTKTWCGCTIESHPPHRLYRDERVVAYCATHTRKGKK